MMLPYPIHDHSRGQRILRRCKPFGKTPSAPAGLGVLWRVAKFVIAGENSQDARRHDRTFGVNTTAKEKIRCPGDAPRLANSPGSGIRPRPLLFEIRNLLLDVGVLL